MNVLICDAIRAHRLLRFVYDGYERVVEPHLYGINTQNHEMLSCWLVGGWSRSETEPGWRNYLVREMHDVHVLAESFDGARPGYNPADDAFRQLFCRLESERDVAAAAVRALLSRIDDAWQGRRWDELAECFDARMVIAPPGLETRVTGRAACVESYRAFMERASLIRYRSGDPTVDLWDDAAVATVPWDMTWEENGVPGRETGHDVFVCRRDGDGPWRAVWRTIVTRGAPG